MPIPTPVTIAVKPVTRLYRGRSRRYMALTIDGYTASARHFAAWLGMAGIPIDAIDDMASVDLLNIGVIVPVGVNGSGCRPTIGVAQAVHCFIATGLCCANTLEDRFTLSPA